MYVISLADFDKVAQQLEGRHHPHYQGMEKTEFNNVVFSFKPFSGSEAEPKMPEEYWRDESLTRDARDVLVGEYKDAHTRWRDAQYIRKLTAAVTGADTLWAAYTAARQEMNDLFAALDSTPSAQWLPTVSRLVAAQENTLTLADNWDDTGREIARAHAEHSISHLSHRQAYERVGVNTDDWVLGSESDYSSYCGAPLVREVKAAIEAQRGHLRTVASLVGDSHPF